MYINKHRLFIAGCSLIVCLFAASISLAQSGSYSLIWVSFQSGGQSVGAGYRMNSLIGAPVAGRQSGGGYQLVIEQAANLASSAPTPVPTVTATPQAEDSYEVDNTCSQAHVLAVNGVSQEHTFHQRGDEDWIAFDAVKDADYRIEVQIPPGSLANVVLDTYKACESATLGPTWDNPNTPGARLTVHSPITGRLYIQAVNHEVTVAGAQVRYLISVTKKEAASTVGALIIVAGRYKMKDDLQPRIFQVANNVYSLFEHQNYTGDSINYLTAADIQNTDDPNHTKYDGVATLQNLQNAITQWAKTRVDANRTLTLYLVDHGYRNLFYLDNPNNEILTPTLLNGWLTQLENNVAGVKINIIIEACKSGSFIQQLSKPNRLIITSTNADKDAMTSDTGAHFSDQFLTSLWQGSNLYTSFQVARTVAHAFFSEQDAWLDANGNGIPNEEEDNQVAAQHGFGQSASLADELNLWPPYVSNVQLVGDIHEASGTLVATVTDNSKVTNVWAVLISPSTVESPDTANELLPDNALPMTSISGKPGQYQLAYNHFDEKGIYRVLVYAVDDDGLQSSPYLFSIQNGNQSQVFLPLVTR
ncbi:MAG: C13 family peptidase [Caldilineaceae bacterium]